MTSEKRKSDFLATPIASGAFGFFSLILLVTYSRVSKFKLDKLSEPIFWRIDRSGSWTR